MYDSDHPRFVVRFEKNFCLGWEVYDELERCSIFGCDRKNICEDYARRRNALSPIRA